jgi:cob(I)alamin adenosyltransferase
MNEDPAVPTDEAHRERMVALQAEMKAKMSAAKERRGLIIVHTGDGKGKSTAAFGMVARMLAHGRRCAIIQFVKSQPDAADKVLCAPEVVWHAVGDGFTWNTQDRAADIERCREGWHLACGYFQDPSISLLLLDELNIVLDYKYLAVAEVLADLRAKRPDLHVVITGRGAPAELIEAADLVTEMRSVKHPFASGVKAQLGIEF